MKYIIIAAIVALATSIAHAENSANYYRFWQGFKRHDLTSQDFIQGLPAFMQSTIDVYQGKGINNYLVALSPVDKPTSVPDEFALLTFDNQADYLAVRNTPAGQSYIDSHWQHFDKGSSASAPMVNLDSSVSEIQFGTAYDVLSKPVTWDSGYVIFFLGLRRSEISTEDFRAQMSAHIRHVADKLGPRGLSGYLMLATRDYEIAYLRFSSEQEANAAFASSDGMVVQREAASMMNNVMFTPTEAFTINNGVHEGHFYSTDP